MSEVGQVGTVVKQSKLCLKMHAPTAMWNQDLILPNLLNFQGKQEIDFLDVKDLDF